MTRPEWVPESLYPFGSNFLNIAGARLHYVDEGEGDPLLLLHGNPTWSFVYRELIKGLSDRFRCIAIDNPGFGLSSAPDDYGYMPADHAKVIEQFVLELDLKNVTMMTQDWGGPIGFWVATRHAERMSGFIVGNTWAWPMTDARTRVFSAMMGGPVGRYMIKRRNLFVEKVLPGGVKRHKLPDEVMAAYRGPFSEVEARKAVHVLPRQIVQSGDFLREVEQRLPSVSDRRTLILWPSDDYAFGENELKRWESIFPGHKTVRLEGAGHYIQEDAPDEIIAAIREWAG
ncbi:alpha/beta fold hydrolase [Amycolatopsis lurida]